MPLFPLFYMVPKERKNHFFFIPIIQKLQSSTALDRPLTWAVKPSVSIHLVLGISSIVMPIYCFYDRDPFYGR